MGILCIFCGIVFLLNPNLRLLDFLPDLLGALLIIIGTSRLSNLDTRIYGARKSMYFLTAVSALKLPWSLYIATKAKDYLLPATFVFSCLETIILITFFTQLIGGLEYFAARDADNPTHSKRAQGAASLLFIFTIARGVLGFIPELLILGEQTDSFDYTYSPTPTQNVAILKPYAEILSFVIVFILGIYTAIVAGKYFIRLAKDTSFIEKLRLRAIQHEEDNIDTYNLRRTNTALALFFISIALLFSPTLDSVNILPNTICFIFLALTIYRFSICEKNKKINLLSLSFITLVPISVFNDTLSYKLLSETDIAIKGTDMRIRQVPALLEGAKNLPFVGVAFILEAALICAVIFAIIIKVEKLPYLAEKKYSVLSELFLKISLPAYLLTNAFAIILSHVRTAYSYMTDSISVYSKYDSIQEIFLWLSNIFFIILLYTSFKYFQEIKDRVKSR